MRTNPIRPSKEVYLGPAHSATDSAQIVEIVRSTLNDPSQARYHADAKKAVNKLLRVEGVPLMQQYMAIAYEIGEHTGALAIEGGLKTADSLANKIQRANVEDLAELYQMTGKMTNNVDVSFHIRDTCRLRMIHPTEPQLRSAAYMMFMRLNVDESTVKDYIKNPKPETNYKALHAVTKDGVELQFRTAYAHARAEMDKYKDIKQLYQGNVPIIRQDRGESLVQLAK